MIGLSANRLFGGWEFCHGRYIATVAKHEYFDLVT